MVETVSPAICARARSTASCTEWPSAWVCQPLKLAPSYSMPSAMRMGCAPRRPGGLIEPPSRGALGNCPWDGRAGSCPPPSAFDLLDQFNGRLALFACAVPHHLVQQLTSSVLHAEVDVAAGEVELGCHLLCQRAAGFGFAPLRRRVEADRREVEVDQRHRGLVRIRRQ